MRRISLRSLSGRERLLWLGQTVYASVEFFLENKLTNHAAGAAYYFLLSIAPLILGIVAILNTSLVNYPELSDKLFSMLAGFNPQLTEDFFRKIGILRDGRAVGGLSLLGFLWTSRQILVAMQTAFDTIFPSKKGRNFFWSVFLSLVLIPGALILLFASALFNGIIRFLYSHTGTFVWLEQIYDLLLSLSGQVLPLFLLFGLIFVCYRYLPVEKPARSFALVGSFLCTGAILGLKAVFFSLISLGRYNLVYGSLGVVIGLLLWAYLVFLIVFFFAQFVHVAGRLEVYILNRMLLAPEKQSALERWLDRVLFLGSEHILTRYGRKLFAGERLSAVREVCYVCRGRVHGYLGAEKHPDTILDSGDIFAVFAYAEESGTLEATEESFVLLMPLELFEGMMERKPELAHTVIAEQSRRLAGQ